MQNIIKSSLSVRFPMPNIVQSMGDFQDTFLTNINKNYFKQNKNKTLEAHIKLGKQETVSSCSRLMEKKILAKKKNHQQKKNS